MAMFNIVIIAGKLTKINAKNNIQKRNNNIKK